MAEWIQTNEIFLWWTGLISLVMFAGTIMVIPLLVIRIPEDYFTRTKKPPSRWRNHHPAIRISVQIVKNTAGALFILIGIVLLFLPGQGIITILVGITLMNFPGKLEMERWIIRRRPVYRAVNWLRKKAHHPPLQLPLKKKHKPG